MKCRINITFVVNAIFIVILLLSCNNGDVDYSKCDLILNKCHDIYKIRHSEGVTEVEQAWTDDVDPACCDHRGIYLMNLNAPIDNGCVNWYNKVQFFAGEDYLGKTSEYLTEMDVVINSLRDTIKYIAFSPRRNSYENCLELKYFNPQKITRMCLISYYPNKEPQCSRIWIDLDFSDKKICTNGHTCKCTDGGGY